MAVTPHNLAPRPGRDRVRFSLPGDAGVVGHPLRLRLSCLGIRRVSRLTSPGGWRRLPESRSPSPLPSPRIRQHPVDREGPAGPELVEPGQPAALGGGEAPRAPRTDRVPQAVDPLPPQGQPLRPRASPANAPALPHVRRSDDPPVLSAAAAAPPPARGPQIHPHRLPWLAAAENPGFSAILHRKLARLPSWFDMLDAELVVVESKRSVRPATVITQVLVPSQHAMRQRVQFLVWVLIPILCVAGLAWAYLLRPPPGPSTEEVLENSRRTLQQAEQVLRDVEQRNAELDRRREIENRGELIELK